MTVENSGNAAGKEVVQLYVNDVESTIFRPEKELKGFNKICLEPGEKKTVKFTLDKRSFAYYNVNLKDWNVESGDFLIIVGSSSRDIKYAHKVHVKSITGYDFTNDDLREYLPDYYNIDKISEISKIEFVKLFGTTINESNYNKKPYNRNSTVDDIKDNFIGKILYKQIMKQVKNMAAGNEYQLQMLQSTVCQLPLRSLVMVSNGIMTFSQVDGLIHLMNGKIFKSVKALLKK